MGDWEAISIGLVQGGLRARGMFLYMILSRGRVIGRRLRGSYCDDSGNIDHYAIIIMHVQYVR